MEWELLLSATYPIARTYNGPYEEWEVDLKVPSEAIISKAADILKYIGITFSGQTVTFILQKVVEYACYLPGVNLDLLKLEIYSREEDGYLTTYKLKGSTFKRE